MDNREGPEHPAPWRRPARSLRFKVTAGVTLVLVVAMGLVFVLEYRWLSREMVERLGLSSTPLSDVIKGSLRHAMQTRNLSELRAILDNVTRQPGVIKVFVVDKKGEVKFSPVAEEIGTRIPLSDPTCQACHRVRPESRSRSVVFTAADGTRIFRNVNPIANEPACVGCHDARDKLNGVLISDFSMAAVDRELSAKLRHMLLALLLTLGATGLMITLIMNRLVIGKLERFAHATRLLGSGKLDVAVDVKPRDEIGELATSFNEMVESLRRARELRQRKELLESVLNHVDDAVVVLAPDGTVMALNRGSERAFGLDSAAVLARAYPLLGEGQGALLEQARREGSVSREMTLEGPGDRSFPARVHVVALRNEEDELLAWVAVAHDLTEARAKERLQEQLAHSEKLAAVGRLAAGVAHELNNPLGHVLLYAKLLLEDAEAETREANAQRIVDNTLRCKAIVRSLLDYARQSELETEWTDLNTLVERSVALMADELRLRGVGYELRLDPELPRVPCDARQIQQVLVNLIQNGIEAIDGAGGTVTVFTTPSRTDDTVVVGVRDDGRGVPPDLLLKVFEPFYTTKSRGTGLGLSISHGIVERHRGTIGVESRCDGPVRGTTFSVKLPVEGRR